MDHRMRVPSALIYLLLLFFTQVYTFIPGVDGPVIHQEALEGGNTTLLCDTSVYTSADEFMLLVWYKNNAPIFSYDARDDRQWSSDSFNTSGRLKADVVSQPTAITISALRQDDQALFHCRVDFLVSPTRNIGVNLTVIVLPSQPFFLDEDGNKVENRIRPYHEGDTLVLICLVIGGRPPPRISWYSGETLVDASDGASDIPDVRENELYLPLTRENAADLSCRASNTKLAPPLIGNLQIELYLPAYNVSIHWVEGTDGETLTVGKPALVQCTALGSYPQPDLSWWLDHKHLTQHSNQTWSSKLRRSVSFLQLTPSVADNGATLACVATNPAMAPSRGSKADVIKLNVTCKASILQYIETIVAKLDGLIKFTISCIATNPAMAPSRGSKADVIKLNVTYSPIVEISRVGDGSMSSVVELDSLQLECEVRANPPVHRFRWYFNDSKIIPGNIWGEQTSSRKLVIEEISKNHAGAYSCAASNSVGETRAEPVSITVYYPPECAGPGISLIKESIKCNVRALPAPDTFFWHVRAAGLDVQHLTTGSPILPLAQVTGPLSGTIKVSCEASNGISNQYEACQRTFSLELLRPPQPRQCDLAYEDGEFHMRCIPVENATYYEVSVWRMSTSNASLVLERRGSMGFGARQEPLAQGVEGGTPLSTGPWLVRGTLGSLRPADEAGAAACNRYGCSAPLLLRPTEYLLEAAEPPWWHFFLERDVGISLGAVVLVVLFAVSSALALRLLRRPRLKPPAPVIQVMQLDDVTNYLDSISEHKVRASSSIRSCSSGYSESAFEESALAPPVDRRRKPPAGWRDSWGVPPPDVTLTLHRESAV